MAAEKAKGGWSELLEKNLEKASNDKKRVEVLDRDALLDEVIRNLLQRNFARPENDEVEELFNIQRGPLASLTHKARLAYVLGLIDKETCDDLKMIHNIRNRFAHGLDAKFTDSEIVKLIKKWCTEKDKKKQLTAKRLYQIYCGRAEILLGNIVEALERDIKEIRAQISKAKNKAKGRTRGHTSN